jgi:steroid 5-alpha reductase family enzyme
MNKSAINSIIGIILAILVGVGLGFAGSQGSAVLWGVPTFALAIIFAYLIQWIAFIFSYINKTEKFYDLTGSLTYISISLFLILTTPNLDKLAVLLFTMVIIWATRLGTFLFNRVMQAGKDDRFDDIKVDFFRLLMTWTLQGLWVSFTAAAAWAAISTTNRVELGVFAVVGFIIWILGYIFELLSDAQKSAFKANPENKGKFIQSGLWALSRHPNYFGEIIIWIGVAIVAFPVLKGWALIALISPLWVIAQLTLISGIPMLEKKADKRWGSQEDYEQYKKNTPVLIPRFPTWKK